MQDNGDGEYVGAVGYEDVGGDKGVGGEVHNEALVYGDVGQDIQGGDEGFVVWDGADV